MTALTLQNVSFSYGPALVLNQISYQFETGKMYCIVGKSGAGKTTLLSILSGLARPSSGQILYHEENIKKNRPLPSAQ